MAEIKRILVVGAVGQIGSELTPALRERYGAGNVVAAGHVTEPSPALRDGGPFIWCDGTDRGQLDKAIKKHKIDTIVNMVGILSAKGEQNPQLCWDVNITSLINSLDAARDLKLTQVLWPSSIAAFGPTTPRVNTPQDTILRPTTMYGVSKVAGELLCDYYVQRYGVDARGLRYPGIISTETLPGGGTTDYAVEIYYKAIEDGRYTCFVREDTMLPMMYMPDCIKSTMDLMAAPFDELVHHAGFNVGAMSFTAGEVAAEIKKHVPNFEVSYEPDFRQEIADSWPRSIDDSAARQEWGWQPSYDLATMTVDMLTTLKARHEKGHLYG